MPPRPTTVEHRELLRAEFVEYMKRFIGTFYSWGGDDPSGFDCSGLAVEGCKSVGVMSRGNAVDYTAHGMMLLYYEYKVFRPYAGCLAFNLNEEGHAIHVEVCINDFQTVGASGGGSNTKTREDAIKHNAFVKIRPIRGTVFVDPLLSLLKNS